VREREKVERSRMVRVESQEIQIMEFSGSSGKSGEGACVDAVGLSTLLFLIYKSLRK
jgi:hypothetical protein